MSQEENHPDAATSTQTQEVVIATLRSALEHEKLRSKTLMDEIKTLRSEIVTTQALSEQEDEYRVNKLSKHVDQIKKEKQDLLRQVEQEEEYITNTLVKKLEQVRREKVDLENQLEQEEEFITNKLQKQLMTVLNDKGKLEKKLELEVSDHHRLAKVESDASDTLRSKLISMEQERDDYEKKNDKMKDQLLKLKTDNFALAQRIKREQEKFTQVNEDKLRLMSNLEMGDERRYNTRSAGMRARSVSLPTEPQLPTSKSAPTPHRLVPSSSFSPSSTSSGKSTAASLAPPHSPPSHARSPTIHTLPHTVIPKAQGRELISAPVRIRDPNAQHRDNIAGGGAGTGNSLVGGNSSRSYAALRDMGTRTFIQLWRMEAAYTNRAQAHDLAIDLASISDYSLDKNDPRCLTLSFSHAATSSSTASHNVKSPSSSSSSSTSSSSASSSSASSSSASSSSASSSSSSPSPTSASPANAPAEPTRVSHTIDALTLTFDKEEQAAEWHALLKELSVS